MANLSRYEQKFLGNQAKMRQYFSFAFEEAGKVYEYCRDFESGRAIFERFKNVKLKITNGTLKKANLYNIKDRGGIFDVAYYTGISENKRRYRVQIFTPNFKTASARIFAISPKQIRNKTNSITQSARRQAGEIAVKFGNAFDVLSYKRAIFHEFAHEMSRKVVRSFDRVSVRKLSEREGVNHKNEQVVFSGINPIYSFTTSKNGTNRKIKWRNTGTLLLEEGVAENIAMSCCESELIFGENPQFYGVDKAQILHRLQNSASNFSAYSLVGLWNCVSDNELIKQHFGTETKVESVAEATEIFKRKFSDFATSLAGEQNKKEFSEVRAQKIVSQYANCVDFCKKQYAILCASGEANENLREFGERLDSATNLNNFVTDVSKYIEMNEQEKDELKGIFAENLGVQKKLQEQAKIEALEEEISKRSDVLDKYKKDKEVDKEAETPENPSIFWTDESILNKDDEIWRERAQEKSDKYDLPRNDRERSFGAGVGRNRF